MTISVGLSRELFHQIYLSSPHYPDDPIGGNTISFSLLLDYFVALVRIPFLAHEVFRIQELLNKGDTFQGSKELRFQTLSTFATSMEILLWLYERGWLVLSRKTGGRIQGMGHLSRMVLYEHAVRKESAVFIKYQRIKKENPELLEKRKYIHLKMNLISHSAFLGWASLNFITYMRGIPYPRSFLKLLHVTSISFGLIAKGYDKDSEFKELYRRYSHHFLNGEIY